MATAGHRVRLAVTRWWRQGTRRHRVYASMFGVMAMLNAAAYLGAPLLPDRNEGDPINGVVVVVMAVYCVAWLYLGHRDRRRQREVEELQDLLQWWSRR
jgi:Flp pilus assembly protein TadB